jgi:hypothetical protein
MNFIRIFQHCFAYNSSRVQSGSHTQKNFIFEACFVSEVVLLTKTRLKNQDKYYKNVTQKVRTKHSFLVNSRSHCYLVLQEGWEGVSLRLPYTAGRSAHLKPGQL